MKRVFGTFYRYRSFPADKGVTFWRRRELKRRIRAMFEDCVFWFANPSTLNDPFDCRPVLLWSENEDENRRRIEETFIEEFEKINGFQPDLAAIKPHIDSVILANHNQADRNKAFWDPIDKQTGVLCLSRRWDIAQQWTYYAGEHSGFCIEFHIDKESVLSAFEMEYVKDRPTVDLAILYGDSDEKKNLAEKCLLKKAEAWRHEEEVRILFHKDGNVQIPGGVLKSLTFGAHTSEKDIVWLRELCGKSGLSLDFYKSALDDRHYTLSREKLQ